jgi:hypothetical protein
LPNPGIAPPAGLGRDRTDASRLVPRRAPLPLVWLGERESASDVARLGARFPATVAKERDLVLGIEARVRHGPRDPVG